MPESACYIESCEYLRLLVTKRPENPERIFVN